MTDIIEQARLAKKASKQVAILSNQKRNEILQDFSSALLDHKDTILSANQIDLDQATNNHLPDSFIDRLKLDDKRIQAMADGILDVMQLEDPLNILLEEKILPSGIKMQKVSSPMGLIAIIYESRPNVTADCASLCLKAGSACLLKGGKESYTTSKAIVDLFQDVLEKHQLPKEIINLAEKPSHEETEKLMACREYVDLLIPRGGKSLINHVVNNAKVPVIETGAGICHIYVDNDADLNQADAIIKNAKCSRPSVCNALETLLVHKDIATSYIPHILDLLEKEGVKFFGNKDTSLYDNRIQACDDHCYENEYNDYLLNIKAVENVDDAINHIEQYGTHHSESILSNNKDNVSKFMNEIDSACLYHNASTRFSDGFEFGLGAEIGISTQKLHARGPMGLKEITTYRYLLYGNGEIRE